jgi:ElaB/YqjD/DUF883 family membrane-anchored ribosome-binding protein
MNGGTTAENAPRPSSGTPRPGGSTKAETEPLQQAATGLADQAARTAEAQASSIMTKTGETLDQVARAIRDAGQGLRQERPEIASLVDTTAQRVEDAAGYLRDHEARQVIDEAQNYARRQPAMVVAGAVAVGLLAGRFLRSSQLPQAATDGERRDMTSRGTAKQRAR